MKFIRFITKCISWLWQLPQNILGLVMKGILCGISSINRRYYNNMSFSAELIVVYGLPGCISLGNYIFINTKATIKHIDHEFGHHIQSVMLGPFYLIVVGIPSFIHACLYPKYTKNKDYYSFWTERWANKLGDVDLHSK